MSETETEKPTESRHVTHDGKKYEINPERYAELSKPFPSKKEALAALVAFQEGVKELRIKHKLRDVHVLIGMSAMVEGERQEYANSLHMGDTSKALPMLATAYGNEKAAWQTALKRMVNPKTTESIDDDEE